jgi:hypothetical protein
LAADAITIIQRFSFLRQNIFERKSNKGIEEKKPNLCFFSFFGKENENVRQQSCEVVEMRRCGVT